MFKGIKNSYKKSEAAVVIQNLLDVQKRAGHFSKDPREIGNALAAGVWRQKQDVFEGGFGRRPHKIAVAAAALANGLEIEVDWGSIDGL